MTEHAVGPATAQPDPAQSNSAQPDAAQPRTAESKNQAAEELLHAGLAEAATRRLAVRPRFSAVFFGSMVALWPLALTLVPRNWLWVALIAAVAALALGAVLDSRTRRLKATYFPLSVYGTPMAVITLTFSVPILLRNGGIPIGVTIAIWLVVGIASGWFTYWWLERWARQGSKPQSWT